MSEFYPFSRWVHRCRTRLPLLLTGVLAVAIAGCTESFDGGAACPSLCPTRPAAFKDTTFDAVVQDTSIAGFPSLGLSSTLLLANRPDTVVTRGVLRFDILPTAFNPNRGADTASITAIDSVFLRLPLDTTGRRGTTPVTLEVFDVDTTVNDSVSAVVKGLFRADRLLASMQVTPSATRDSLIVPLSKAKVLAKITGRSRLRLGLRLTGGAGQLRLVAYQLGSGAPTVSFDPSSDTTYAPATLVTTTSFTATTSDLALSYQVYALIDKGSAAPDANTLIVGGYPAYRSYLRFDVPKSITDSATIVRAEVLLTQRRSSFGNAFDTVSIVPLVPTTTNAVTDLRRILDLAAEGTFASLDTARLVPSDSGVRALNVLALVRTWPTLPTTVPRSIAFRIGLEGAQPAELRFFSRKALPALRPRLRITYQPRTEFAIP